MSALLNKGISKQIRVITVLMVFLNYDQPGYAGNYRRIFMLLRLSPNVHIDYLTAEIKPMKMYNSQIKERFGFTIPEYKTITPYVPVLPQGKSETQTDVLSSFSLLLFKIINLIQIIIRTLRNPAARHADIVCVPDICRLSVLGGYLISKLIRRPCVVTIQLLPPWIVGAKDGTSGLYRELRKTNPPVGASVQSLAAAFLLFVLSKSALIFMTQYSLELYVKSTKSKSDNCFVNPNGLFEHQITLQTKKEFDAIFIGTQDERKGIIHLIEVWKHVVAKQSGAQLLTVGELSPEMNIKIQSKIHECSLERNVTVKTPVSESEKMRLLASSKLLVVPKHQALPMVVGEAISAGIPVIAYDRSPPLREIYGYESPLLVKQTDNPVAFAKTVTTLLLMSPNERSKLSEPVGQNNDQYEWNATMLRERAVYENILELTISCYHESIS